MPSIKKCLGAVSLSSLLVAALCYYADAKTIRHKTVAVAEKPVGQDVKPTECAGLLCMMTPGSMARPITVAEAARIQAERLQRLESLAAEQANSRKKAHPHVASRVRVVHSTRGRVRLAAGRGGRFSVVRAARLSAFRIVHVADARRPGGRSARIPVERTAGGEARATNSSIVEPVAMFGLTRPTVHQSNYRDWLRRMAWSEGADRPYHSNAFSLVGYRDPAIAASDTAAIAVDGGPDFDSRASALSRQGFNALKTAFKGS